MTDLILRNLCQEIVDGHEDTIPALKDYINNDIQSVVEKIHNLYVIDDNKHYADIDRATYYTCLPMDIKPKEVVDFIGAVGYTVTVWTPFGWIASESQLSQLYVIITPDMILRSLQAQEKISPAIAKWYLEEVGLLVRHSIKSKFEWWYDLKTHLESVVAGNRTLFNPSRY